MRASGTTLAALLLAFSSTLPAAEQARKPNILFAVADDWSYGHAGAYGCQWVKTPALDRVARAGILFTHAYTPDGKCAPSRACIITGRNP
jgi:arylsulfatase A-like enzyme